MVFFVFIFNFYGTHYKKWFGLQICTQFTFSISKKVGLNIGNENEFWSFSFSAKTNTMAFLYNNKKSKIFGPHT